MYLSDLIDYKKTFSYLVDKDPSCMPDFSVDLNYLVSFNEKSVPTKSINRIIIHYCGCHAQRIFSFNPNLLKEFLRVLKPLVGEIWVVSKHELYDLSVLDSYFEATPSIKRNQVALESHECQQGLKLKNNWDQIFHQANRIVYRYGFCTN